jgi:tRNA-dihydrouridine synthase C
LGVVEPPGSAERLASTRIRRIGTRMEGCCLPDTWIFSEFGKGLSDSVSGSADVMIGRGAVADPFLARRIRARRAGKTLAGERSADWLELRPLVADYWQAVRPGELAITGRLKQWVGQLARTFVEADALFRAIRHAEDVAEIARTLEASGVPVRRAAA